MIYLDTSALVKFVKPEAQSQALRSWRALLPTDMELVTSALAELEISRTLHRAGVDPQRIPYVTAQAVKGVFLVGLTRTILARAQTYSIQRLGSLDAIHLATADPLREGPSVFVTYDDELSAAATELGFRVLAPVSAG